MKTNYKLALTLLAGVGLGAAAIQGLHAQAKPHAYAVIENNVVNQEAFAKELFPAVVKIITDAGGKYLARGGKMVGIEGQPFKRLIVIEFENMEKAEAAFSSAAYKDARKIGEKYSKVRTTIVEGVSQ
jgi:uncharacterized protein (DUF1330 family)